MTERLSRIEGQLDPRALSKKCEKEGCSVSLQGLQSPYLLVDLDRPGSPLRQHETRCDYILFCDHDSMLHVAALELKGGRARSAVARGQLEAGAKAAEQLCASEGSLRFRAVLVHGRNLRKAERKRISVRFRDSEHRVYFKTCGSTMTQVLDIASTIPKRRRMPKGRRR